MQQKGLTTEQANQLLQKYGKNATESKNNTTFLRKFLAQFGDLMIVILLIAAVLSFVMALISNNMGDLFEPIIIVAIVVANAILGAVQEHKAEKSLQALSRITSPKTKVLRDGVINELDSQLVVPNDICLFQLGDIVTCDCVVRQGEVFVNQSALTGESLPVEKGTDGAKSNDKNTLYSGSFITKGSCYAQVFATGSNTELGKIATILSDSDQALTPLQQKLKHLSKVLGIVCLAVCLAVLVMGFAKAVAHKSASQTLTGIFVEVFLTSVSLAVAAIPEGLPAVVTVVLANGISNMASKNAIVKRLTAVEALGSATVICTDKTGTLTQNKMTLVGVFDGKSYLVAQNIQSDNKLLQAYSLCCDCNFNGTDWLGDPTEIAVASITKMPNNATLLDQIPFDSTRKLMTVAVQIDGKSFVITKGSLQQMSCADNYQKYQQTHDLLAQKGLRVLALSVTENTPFDKTQMEKSFHIVGLFALADPPREEVFDAVAKCKMAGIKTVMITGDSLQTAKEIASQIGILQEGDIAVDGATLNSWTEAELQSNVQKTVVYARVSAIDKYKIVSALQKQGHIVAMTGDGVNDAPALKNASIGCAMGSGTEVAKDASDIILTDDNFATIVHAIEVGRSVFDNIKKAITYLLTCNIGEVFCVFFALIFWDVSPLSAMQLLWINLVTDGLPALALGTYKSDVDVMQKPPRKSQNFFDNGGGRRVALGGVLFGVVTLIGYAVGNVRNYQSACTMAFLILSLAQLFFALHCRSSKGLFGGGMTKLMAITFILSVGLVCVVAFVPLFCNMFDLCLLSPSMYFCALGLALLPTIVFEFCRLANKKAYSH